MNRMNLSQKIFIFNTYFSFSFVLNLSRISYDARVFHNILHTNTHTHSPLLTRNHPETVLFLFPKRSLSLAINSGSIFYICEINVLPYFPSHSIIHSCVLFFILIYIFFSFRIWHCCKRAEGQ